MNPAEIINYVIICGIAAVGFDGAMEKWSNENINLVTGRAASMITRKYVSWKLAHSPQAVLEVPYSILFHGRLAESKTHNWFYICARCGRCALESISRTAIGYVSNKSTGLAPTCVCRNKCGWDHFWFDDNYHLYPPFISYFQYAT